MPWIVKKSAVEGSIGGFQVVNGRKSNLDWTPTTEWIETAIGKIQERGGSLGLVWTRVDPGTKTRTVATRRWIFLHSLPWLESHGYRQTPLRGAAMPLGQTTRANHSGRQSHSGRQ